MKRQLSLFLVFLVTFILVGCSVNNPSETEDQERLTRIEIHSNDGTLMGSTESSEIIDQFNNLNFLTDMDYDEDEQKALEKDTQNLTPSYTIISYLSPVAVVNDGEDEKQLEITLYENSDVARIIALPESDSIPNEFLTFYSPLSDKDRDFLLSLVNNVQ